MTFNPEGRCWECQSSSHLEQPQLPSPLQDVWTGGSEKVMDGFRLPAWSRLWTRVGLECRLRMGREGWEQLVDGLRLRKPSKNMSVSGGEVLGGSWACPKSSVSLPALEREDPWGIPEAGSSGCILEALGECRPHPRPSRLWLRGSLASLSLLPPWSPGDPPAVPPEAGGADQAAEQLY